jgi:large repetitive protein
VVEVKDFRMIKFLRHKAEISFLRERLFDIALAVLICLWTAGAMAQSPPVGTLIVNQAAVQGSDANGNPLPAVISNTVSAPLSGAPLLKITSVAGPNPVSPGRILTYTITITNTGNASISGITLKDTLPSGVTFLNADQGGILQGGIAGWIISALDPGKTITVNLSITLDKTFSGASISNTAIVSATGMTNQSSTVSTDISHRTPGEVAFFNVDWQPAYGYMIGDTIYIQVKDADQNVDPDVAETVTITLKDLKTLDTETVVLTETGTNTGIFRGSILTALQTNASSANVLAETGTNAGIYRGSILTALQTNASSDGVLTVTPDSSIQVTYTDNLDATPVDIGLALINPAGIVFNSITGSPIKGAVVTVRNWNTIANSCDRTSSPALPPGQFNPAAPTGADGKFVFPLVTLGDYCFDVAPLSGYTYPSLVADSDLPAGFTIGNGSRGGKFSLHIGDPNLIDDIPVDPPSSRLTITKTANKTTAAIGEMLIYTLKLTNNGNAPFKSITISDVMPHGITYIAGSSKTNENAFADPHTTSNRTLAWPLADLAPNKSFTISYRAVVGPDTQAGDRINTATALGTSVGKPTVSNQASVNIKITEGVFTSKGTIVGSVFIDRNGDGLPKKETGVANAVLYLEDGTRVITDKSGKFSISGVDVGTHVLRLDETSVPKDLTSKPLSNRFMNNGTSQFVDMTTSGLFKANFALDKKHSESSDKPEEEGKKIETANSEQSNIAPPTSAGEANQKVDSTNKKNDQQVQVTTEELPLEEKIKNMAPDLEILSPADRALSGKTNIRVLIKASMDGSLILTVNGMPVNEDHIGKKITYEKSRVAIYEFLDVRLKTGEENIISAEFKDQFNIVRGKKQLQVEAIGEMAQMVIVTDRNRAEADGQSKIGVTVSLEDKKGHAIPYDNALTVDVTAGEILEKDADPANVGHQVMCLNGTAHFTVVAPREAGEAKISVQANSMTKSADIYFVPSLRPMFIVGIGEIVLGHGRSSGDIGYLKDRSFYGDGTYLDGREAFFIKGNVYKDILLTASFDSE